MVFVFGMMNYGLKVRTGCYGPLPPRLPGANTCPRTTPSVHEPGLELLLPLLVQLRSCYTLT